MPGNHMHVCYSILSCAANAALYKGLSCDVARYASRAKKYAIQRRNIVAQAGIEDSLLCSTTTATAATGSTTVSLTETAGDSSVDTLQTDSLFASPALSALPET